MRTLQAIAWPAAMLFAGAAWAGASTPAPSAPAGQRLVCKKRSQCRGPKLLHRHFVLLSDPKLGMSVAAARRHWGDYDKLYLVLTNFGSRLMDFRTGEVAVSEAKGAWTGPVNLTILSSSGGGGFPIYFGDNPKGMLPTVTPQAPIPTSPEARRMVSMEPISQADLKLESQALQRMAARLEPALEHPLHSQLVQPKVILAGYLYFPRPQHGRWKRLRVEVPGVRFLLPLK